MDEIFKALADANRRKLLDSLAVENGQTLQQMAAALPDMTRFGVMKHLKLLEAANLVSTRKMGRFKYHYLNPVPIAEISNRWIDKFTKHTATGMNLLKHQLEAKNSRHPNISTNQSKDEKP
ncbi:MAG: helix-turn-helix transcriptional regulator [Rhizobiales bacterium]|nr:helix-turn-helix domain-containing protein [Hyphomicrobiales bacterium]NRB13024.1 helix-turn-helix transcriptional regulator [Hyphomicrobiales bacterium]